MRADPSIFHAYDIRGIVPDELDAAAAEQIGRALAAHLKPQQAVVGRDVRKTGPELKAATIKGLVVSGVDVLDIGQVSTDEYYFACAEHKLPGILVTASHNPPEYNGFKMISQFPEMLLPTDLMPWVLDKKYTDADKPGSVEKLDVHAPFLTKMLSLVDAKAIKPLKVVIDTSNGAQGPVWEQLTKQLAIEAVPLFWEPDGNFPNHPNDVIQPEAKVPLIAKVKETGADLGLIFDPDGDRCLVVDDRAAVVPGDFLTAMLAEYYLKRSPGSKIVYDIRASDAVPDTITAAGGTPVVAKVGHGFIKPKMREENAVFGGEVSGHFYFRDYHFGDNGILSALTLLEYASELGTPLSERVKSFEAKYHLSGEINSKVKDPAAVMEDLKTRYASGKLDKLDGIAIRYPDWHFVVRPSNNEPLLRLTLEASSATLMQEKRDEVLTVIRSENG